MFRLLLILLLIATGGSAQESGTFTNPLLPSGPDPYSCYHEGYYYYTNSMGDSIVLWKTKDLAELKNAERRTIYKPPPKTSYSKELWAPEVMFLRGKWYAYFAADNGNNNNHRMYALEHVGSDPMVGEWVFKGKIADATDKWAIDGDVFEYKGALYMIWSGWEGDVNRRQDIYLARMKDPLTIESARTLISKPAFDWETVGDLHDANNPPHVDVNEGPQALQRNEKLFVIFSASGCWTDHYALGLLEFKGGDILDASNWKKQERPVFTGSIERGVYAPGHNSFFKSPDGKEDWILYHANPSAGDGCGRHRSPRAQRFNWNADGSPDFGIPVKEGVPVRKPATINEN